jgi:thymidylate synthase
MLANTWNRIIDWFRDRSERNQLIRSFNDSAKNAFIVGSAPTLLKSSISKGESNFRHQFSNWLNTGFRIQAFSGRQLAKEEINQIGEVILNDNVLIRRLIVLGWDTLEIHGDEGKYGLRWQIKDYIALPQ